MRYLILSALFLALSTMAYAASCVSGNCVNGHGTYVWDSGAQYSGDWQNQKRHGRGTFTYGSGETYTGDWVNNQKHGQGTYVWPGGSQFTGGWKNNKAHGEGIYTFANGQRAAQVLNMGQLVSERALNQQGSGSRQSSALPAQASSLSSGRKWKRAE
ncbi:hypothetical protein [Desulfogranum marinum]|uniref:MORN repeat-containing protein n=1 Tax=Desulfogranum marinum TaxID=453220 RepID=UPI0029C827E7|nr:hypothetical protein [Desulfogranum marinum]